MRATASNQGLTKKNLFPRVIAGVLVLGSAAWAQSPAVKARPTTTVVRPERAVPAYAGLAVLWLEEGVKLEEARELLRLASSLKKDDPAVARGMALYEEKKKVRDAEQSAKKIP